MMPNQPVKCPQNISKMSPNISIETFSPYTGYPNLQVLTSSLLNIELTTHHHKLAVISISIQLVETYFLRLLDILFVEVRRVCSYVQRGPSGADSCLEYKMVELRKRGSSQSFLEWSKYLEICNSIRLLSTAAEFKFLTSIL